MSHSKRIWPTVYVMSALTLSVPPVVYGQNHGIGTSESGSYHYMHGATVSGARQDFSQNFSADEIFTQAERDLVSLVRDNLAVDPAVAPAATGLEIRAEQGTVTLRGNVPTTQDRDLIVGKVERLNGVTRVDDRLRVTDSVAGVSRDRMAMERPSTTYSSPTIRQPMPTRTSGTTGFPATGDRGTEAANSPALVGSGSMHEEDRTGTSGPSGSNSVSTLSGGAVDAIGRTTKPAGDYAVTEVDRGLVGLIRQGFINHPDLLATEDNLHIKVDNGLVTLSGWVRSDSERQMIESKVREVSGVQGVVSQLDVRPNSSLENSR